MLLNPAREPGALRVEQIADNKREGLHCLRRAHRSRLGGNRLERSDACRLGLAAARGPPCEPVLIAGPEREHRCSGTKQQDHAAQGQGEPVRAGPAKPGRNGGCDRRARENEAARQTREHQADVGDGDFPDQALLLFGGLRIAAHVRLHLDAHGGAADDARQLRSWRSTSPRPRGPPGSPRHPLIAAQPRGSQAWAARPPARPGVARQPVLRHYPHLPQHSAQASVTPPRRDPIAHDHESNRLR